jgi:hypothetical protein
MKMALTTTLLNICITAMINNTNCPEVLALAELESSFNKNAIGAVGEKGLFQIRPEYYGKVPKTVQGQTEQVLEVLKYVRGRCQKDISMNWILCYNVGVTKGRTMLKSKKGPYRLNYIKLVGKWKKWYERKETRNILLTELFNRTRTQNMVKAQRLVQIQSF